jgi:hypothetical protein
MTVSYNFIHIFDRYSFSIYEFHTKSTEYVVEKCGVILDRMKDIYTVTSKDILPDIIGPKSLTTRQLYDKYTIEAIAATVVEDIQTFCKLYPQKFIYIE